MPNLRCDTFFSTPVWETTLDIDNNLIIDYVNNLREKGIEHVKNLNQGGYQYFDLIDTPDIYNDLIKKINEYLETITCRMKLREKSHVLRSWININTPNSYNIRHIHSRSLFSGVFYVSVPEGDSGNIIFHNNNLITNYLPPYIVERWNNVTSSTVNIKPQNNMLLIFPGWLEHSVTTNITNQNRISISFNTNCY